MPAGVNIERRPPLKELLSDIWTITKWFFTELIPMYLSIDFGVIGTIGTILGIITIAITFFKRRR